MALARFNFPPFPFAMKRLPRSLPYLLYILFSDTEEYLLRSWEFRGVFCEKRLGPYFTGSIFLHITKKKSLKGTDFREDCQNTDLFVLELTQIIFPWQ